MMAATTTATVSSILLPDDVWDDLAVFRDMVCMAIVALDSDSNDHMYKNATEIIVGAIGKDPAKPYALIDVVHDKMITQPSWASIVAIRFYKSLFSELDLSFLEDKDFSQSPASGAETVVKNITDKCVVEIECGPNWTVPPVTSIISFIEGAFEAGGNLISFNAVCYVLTRISESVYLFFEKNLKTLLNFYRRVIPRINGITPAGRSEQVEKSLLILRAREAEGTQRQAEMIEETLRVFDLDYSALRTIFVQGDVSTAPVRIEELDEHVQEGLVLFSTEVDWNCHAITRMVDGVREHTFIGAPSWTE